MNPEELEILRNGNLYEIKAFLRNFKKKVYVFLYDSKIPNKNGQWIETWNEVFNILRNDKNSEAFPEALSCVRILATDLCIRNHNIKNHFDCLLKITNLATESSKETELASTDATVDALECLRIMVAWNTGCQKACLGNSLIDGIMKHVRSGKIYRRKIEYSYMKLLFLITAREPATREKVRDGFAYLNLYLDVILEEKENNASLIFQIFRVLCNISDNKIADNWLRIVARKLYLAYEGTNFQSPGNMMVIESRMKLHD